VEEMARKVVYSAFRCYSADTMVELKNTKDHPRAGWEEDSKAIAAAGDDKLVWPYFENDADEDWVWEGDLGLPERVTARVLLLDSQDRLLLMHINDQHKQEMQTFRNVWVTIGGRLEEGESVLAAARREVAEEAGLTAIEVGPAVWYGEQILTIHDEIFALKETFVVARTSDCTLKSDKWTVEEKVAIKKMRWWTLADMRSTKDTILPKRMIERLPTIIAGHYPAEVESIPL
jgi:8-oxo-dGTP pyrophosphatase MutT (NUDIX family)